MACKSALERMPVEIRQQLLGLLPDLMSLRSAILTCSSFHQAFISAEVLLTTSVLKNQVDLEVLPEAVAALESSYLRPWTRERIQDFVHYHLDSRKSQLPSWTLSEALPLDSLHRHVQSFAAAFALEALTKQLGLDELDAIPKYPPSSDEIHRIQRALYRFELYCNLFGDPKRTEFKINEQMRLFFFKFSPWEIEQLGSIHDYLFRVISPGIVLCHLSSCPSSMLKPIVAFNDIAEEDMAWGAFEVNIADELGSGYVQHLMSLGLVCIHEIAAAKTYEDRYSVIYDVYPNSNLEFLHEPPGRSNEHDDGLYLCDYKQADEERLDRHYAPFFHEQDPGPERAWRWAHQDVTRANFVYADSEQLLRERGYCFWDLNRLEAWPLFHQHWERPTLSPSAENEKISWRAQIQATFDRRASIYRLGGRGRMCEVDENKLIQSTKNEAKVPSLMSIYKYRRDKERRLEDERLSNDWFGTWDKSF